MHWLVIKNEQVAALMERKYKKLPFLLNVTVKIMANLKIRLTFCTGMS